MTMLSKVSLSVGDGPQTVTIMVDIQDRNDDLKSVKLGPVKKTWIVGTFGETREVFG